VQVAVAFCKDAHNMSFIPGMNDVHGKGTDLTFRHLQKAKPQKILMNNEFYNQVRGRQNKYWPQFREILAPSRENLKGFKEPVQVYRWCDPQSESPPRCLKPAEQAQKKGFDFFGEWALNRGEMTIWRGWVRLDRKP